MSEFSGEFFEKWQLLKTATIKNKEELLDVLRDWDSFFQKPFVMLLQGPMGVGKTEFVRNFAMMKGFVSSSVTSPSFAIHQRYQDIEIDHFDLFRLSSEEDLESTGFWDLLENGEGWIFIEWPERLREDQISRRIRLLKIVFKIQSNESRYLELYSLRNC